MSFLCFFLSIYPINLEYDIPAIVGTGNITQRVKQGQRIRVNVDVGIQTEGSANKLILAFESVIFSTIGSSNCPLSWINSFGSTAGSGAR